MSAEPVWVQKGKQILLRDAVFRRVLQKHPNVPLKRLKKVDLFQALAHAIVNQQLSGRVADVIYNRLAALFPGNQLDPKRLLKMRDTRLRGVGLSWNKVRFLKDLARHIVEDRLPTHPEIHALTDEVILEKLTAVHGIGPWTVQMLMIFKLGRPDVFPHADLGVQKGFQKLFRLKEKPTSKFLEEHALRWKPYRTLAAWYLWRVSDHEAFNPVEGDVLWAKSEVRPASSRPTRRKD